MLEFLVLWQLGKSVAARARKKGKSAARYVFLLLGLWFVGEALGAAVCYLVLAALIGAERADRGALLIYPVAIAGASVGAYATFKIAAREAPLAESPAGS